MPEGAANGKSLGHAWWLKLLILLALAIPPFVAGGLDPRDTSEVVPAVLAHPVLNDLAVLVVLAKYALLAVAVACLVRPALLGPLGWGYYAATLLLLAFGQNMAVTERFGFVWLVGNTVIQLVAFAAVDVRGRRTRATAAQLRRGRSWVLAPAALAWLFPFIVRGEDVRPGVPATALVNEAGLTYCMVTPVVLALMILYADGVHPPTLSVTAWVGLLFGVLNAVTWFVLAPASWWMGVLHLPLLVLSGYAAWLARRGRLTPSSGASEFSVGPVWS